MKAFLTFLTSLCLIFAFAGEAHAKRFGGGGFGKSHKTTPFFKKKSEPQKQQQQGQNAAQKKRGGMMGGLLGGLLAGGLFAALLGSGAFEGIQFMDIILFALLAFIALKIFRSLAGAQRQPAIQGAGYGQQPQQRQSFEMPKDAPAGGHAFDATTAQDQSPRNLPPGFDADGFVQGALEHYRTVQQAWNDGKLEVIEEYVSAPLFAGLKQQRERLMVPPQTEILDLNADIVRADQNGSVAEISVLFRGLCKDELEKSEDGIFDTWHLERDTAASDSNWVIVGIEAE